MGGHRLGLVTAFTVLAAATAILAAAPANAHVDFDAQLVDCETGDDHTGDLYDEERVNVVFQGADLQTVRVLVEQHLGWEPTNGHHFPRRGTPTRDHQFPPCFLDHGQIEPDQLNLKETAFKAPGGHMRLKESNDTLAVLASVHYDDCLGLYDYARRRCYRTAGLHEGSRRGMRRERERVADAFRSAGFPVVHLGDPRENDAIVLIDASGYAVSPPGQQPSAELEVFGCGSGEWQGLRHGDLVVLQHGIGFGPLEFAIAERDDEHAVVIVDGLPHEVFYEGLTEHFPGFWGDRARALWRATLGTHTVQSWWSHENEGFPGDICTFTIDRRSIIFD